jgi:hypothetical protein
MKALIFEADQHSLECLIQSNMGAIQDSLFMLVRTSSNDR